MEKFFLPLNALLFLSLFFFCLPRDSDSLTISELESSNQELLKWDPPIEMKEAYPYYLAGHDDHGNPVWVLAFGKWDIRWLSEGGSEFLPLMKNYTNQAFLRYYQSAKIAARELEAKNAAAGLSVEESENGIEGFICVCDMDGYSNRQYLHPPTVKLTLEIFQGLYNLEKTDRPPGMKSYIGVNVNFAGRSIWTLINSQLGPFASKFELHGTTASKWKHHLTRQVPMSILPRGLGGNQDFKPLEIHGKK